MKLLVEFEYDDKKLGKGWFNIFNLRLCLFSQQHTKKELLKVKEIKNAKDIVEIDKDELKKVLSTIKWGNREWIAKDLMSYIKVANPIKWKEE